MAKILTDRVFAWFALSVAVYAVLRLTIEPNNLIIGLNGILIGVGVALVFAFFGLLFQSVFGGKEFDRANQMALGVFVAWVVIYISVGNSTYLRAEGLAPSSTVDSVIIQRYLAIFAAVLQITAPDFGKGFFYGRDRRVLVGSSVAGFIVAMLVIWFQYH